MLGFSFSWFFFIVGDSMHAFNPHSFHLQGTNKVNNR